MERKILNCRINFMRDYSQVRILVLGSNPETLEIIQKYKEKINFYQHKLDKNYGAHKNYGIELCKGKWIFQFDSRC